MYTQNTYIHTHTIKIHLRPICIRNILTSHINVSRSTHIPPRQYDKIEDIANDTQRTDDGQDYTVRIFPQCLSARILKKEEEKKKKYQEVHDNNRKIQMSTLNMYYVLIWNQILSTSGKITKKQKKREQKEGRQICNENVVIKGNMFIYCYHLFVCACVGLFVYCHRISCKICINVTKTMCYTRNEP